MNENHHLNLELYIQKNKFLNIYGKEYGYEGKIDELREKEFSRLKENIYLDHAGATLYSEFQIKNINENLINYLYGNPHSISLSSNLTSSIIEEIRNRILNFFHTNNKKYSIIFTSGCTASLKMIGETFPWHSSSKFYYLKKSHNSLLGIREYVTLKGGNFYSLEWNQIENLIEETNDNIDLMEKNNDFTIYDLIAFPLEENFSGEKYSLKIIKELKKSWKRKYKNRECKILVDAASFIPNSKLDLEDDEDNVDFVAFSFYKLFGYPTGVGALLIKNDCGSLLKKIFFGGGTVTASLSDDHFHSFRSGISEKFEDGTSNFLNIISLQYGLDIIENLGIDNITKHTHTLLQYLYNELISFKHYNEKPVCKIYGCNHIYDSSKQGPILNFNLLRSNGSYVGYNEVEQLASLNNIHLRTGCFCNPGACHSYLNLSKREVLDNLSAGHVCWDNKDVINGKPTGSIRISLGYMSTFEDAYKFLNFIKKYFVEKEMIENNDYLKFKNILLNDDDLTLKKIYIYPIKSCGSFEVNSWEIKETGFLYDREWVLIDNNGSYLNQKKISRLCLIKPIIDKKNNILILNAPEVETLILSLSYIPNIKIQLTVCGDICEGFAYEDNINHWFSKFLNVPCTLVRMSTMFLRTCEKKNSLTINYFEKQKFSDEENITVGSNISFVNESQFLIISNASVDDLLEKINDSKHSINALSFRPNLLIDGGIAYQEDNWSIISIGDQFFEISGLCNRCKMICIDQETGIETKEPLLTLAKYRRNKGKILFGIHANHIPSLSNNNSNFKLKCGQKIQIIKTKM